VEVARAPAGVPTSGPGATGIVVQPVGEESLKTGTPVSSQPGASGNATGNPGNPQESSTAKAPEASAASDANKASDSNPPAKKKGKRSFFKRLIKPF
jgi:hypothetical protein